MPASATPTATLHTKRPTMRDASQAISRSSFAREFRIGVCSALSPLPLNRTMCEAPRLGNYLLWKVRGGLRDRVAFISSPAR
jgi:hypothetical protein